MNIIKGGITSAQGFSAAYTQARIKYKDRDDMAMIYSDAPCTYAAAFTKNVVKAAPVRWDMDIENRGSKINAVIINSGMANAATGTEGMFNCVDTADHAAKRLGIERDNVLVASTGVIGMQLPMDRIREGIDKLAEGLSDTQEAGDGAAKAIMTTDTHEKQVCVTFELGETKVTIGGMAKGSGMIHPNMGTMLAFFTTDVDISRDMLKKAVLDGVEETFNMVSVDGDTSTNDTCMVLANGQAANKTITKMGEYYDIFAQALKSAFRELAIMIAADGEGATALLEVKVSGADSVENARTLAKSVACSSLTKAAVFGHDANWGRIICALGYSGVEFEPSKVDISVESQNGRVDMARFGMGTGYSEEEATKVLDSDHVIILCDMHAGDAEATAWGCDLSYDYVKINADYRS